MGNYKSPKIIYLYVNNWDYMHSEDENIFDGHPKAGHVYRAIVDEDGIKIPITTESDTVAQGILIRKLVDENERWKHDIKEIKEEDIALLDISKEDLEKIKIWEDIDNSDIKLKYKLRSAGDAPEEREVPSGNTIASGIEEIIKEMAEQDSEDVLIGTFFRILMEYMYSRDPRFLVELQSVILSELTTNLNEKLK